MASFSDCIVEPAIVRRASKGDMQAHAVLFRTFSPAVYTLARRMLNQPALADEILQETFLEVLGKISGFSDKGPFAAWIRRIAVNKCLMHLRSAWNRHGVGLEAGETAPGSGELADTGRPEGFAEQVQARLDLSAALERLNDTSRTVVWLHDVEGFTHREIGELMGRTASFSKSQLARAHERLQGYLGGPNTEEEKTCMRVLKSC
jgi:RNA polymerase sigma factor (sigma-70 family)